MASAIDDLRYISRMGYQDPWAEATKKISDSLLAYGQSKLQRDTLIAQYKDKQEQLDYTRNRNAQTDAMNMIKGESPEVKAALLNNEDFVKNLPETYVESMKPVVGQQVQYNTEMKSLYNTVTGDGSLDERILALNTAKKSFRPDDKYNPSRFTKEATILKTDITNRDKSRVVYMLAKKYYDKGILDLPSYNTILEEAKVSGANADVLLKDYLASERADATDMREYYDLGYDNILLKGNKLVLSEDAIRVEVKELQNTFERFFKPEVRNARKPNNEEFSFEEKMVLQAMGVKEKLKAFQTGIVTEDTATPADSTVTDANGNLTKLSSPTFSVDSNDRFALNESDFEMPPESQVELEYPNGQKKIVTGQNAYQQLKKPGVKRTGQKSGIYLKIGVGTNPLLNRRAGSKIAGLIDDDSTMDVSIVYQNPSKGQYESFSGLRDGAFTTRNIKLKNNDLLIDVDTGRYHKVIIIPPPKGEALRFKSAREVAKEALTTRPLDKTIFRVGGNDYNAQELIKKYMIPMSVPKETQDEQVERAPSAIRLIGITPVKKDSIPIGSGEDTTATMHDSYQEWLFKNINKSAKKKLK